MHAASTRENVQLRLGGVTRWQVRAGSVLCALDATISVARELVVRMRVLEVPRAQRLIAPGYRAAIHLGTSQGECRVRGIYPEGATKFDKSQQFVMSGNTVKAILTLQNPVCVERFATSRQFGQFTLRGDGVTIAAGQVLDLVTG